MPAAHYRGFTLSSVGNSTEVWQVKIKNHVLSGHMAAIKKSIDWWCETASLIDPKEFESLASKKEASSSGPMQEQFGEFLLRNDTGQPTDWYCMLNGRLMKGAKLAIQKHLEAYIIARNKATTQKK